MLFKFKYIHFFYIYTQFIQLISIIQQHQLDPKENLEAFSHFYCRCIIHENKVQERRLKCQNVSVLSRIMLPSPKLKLTLCIIPRSMNT